MALVVRDWLSAGLFHGTEFAFLWVWPVCLGVCQSAANAACECLAGHCENSSRRRGEFPPRSNSMFWVLVPPRPPSAFMSLWTAAAARGWMLHRSTPVKPLLLTLSHQISQLHLGISVFVFPCHSGLFISIPTPLVWISLLGLVLPVITL